MLRIRRSSKLVLITIFGLFSFLSLTKSTAKDLAIVNQAILSGRTWIISKSDDGIQGNDMSEYPSISGNGKYVVFNSRASNLVLDDSNGNGDVFLFDRQINHIRRISVNEHGIEGNDGSYQATISTDGKFIAFESWASNLVEGDTNNATDIFVHNLTTGLTKRVSVSSSGIQGNGYSGDPSISSDGRYVAFSSTASNLAYNDNGSRSDIFVHDLLTGVTELISITTDGQEPNRGVNYPTISGNGLFVAFHSGSTNLVSGDTNGTTDIFVHDRQTDQTEIVTVSSDGVQANSYSDDSSLSYDGRYVAFTSSAANLVNGDTNNSWDIFIRDRQTGVTQRVSITHEGSQSNSTSNYPAISPDGKYIAFTSWATNLLPTQIQGGGNIYLRNNHTGEIELISIGVDGDSANEVTCCASISSDAQIVAFESRATNLIHGDTNIFGHYNIFVRDRLAAPGNYQISGKTIDSEGKPVQGVQISSDHGLSTVSDNSGNYSIAGLSPGTYSLTPSMNGYIFSPESNHVSVPPDQNSVDFVAARNFRVSHIEVTQGIQSFPPLVELIEEKPTVARVYLESISGRVSGITGKLFVSIDSGETWDSIDPINAPVYAVEPIKFERQSRYHSLEFILEENMLHGTITIYAEVSIPTTTLSVKSSQYTLKFNLVDQISIAYIPFRTGLNFPDADRISSAQEFIVGIYPGTIETIQYYKFPTTLNLHPWLTHSGNLSKTIDYLNAIYAMHELIGWPAPHGRPDQLFGWFSYEGWNDQKPLGKSNPKYAKGWGNVAVGVDDPTNRVYQAVLAHEVGHNLERRHPECSNIGINNIGYDLGYHSVFNPILGVDTTEFMASSVCGVKYFERWISAFNFNQLYQEINNLDSLNSVRIKELSSELLITPMLLVSGTINTDETASLDPVFQVQADQAVNQNPGTEYCLKLEDSGGSELEVSCFDISFIDPETEESLNKSSFLRILSDNSSAKKLVLYKGTKKIVEKAISINVPSVTLVSPNGGEMISKSTKVIWDASDLDGDSLTSMVSYSIDSGQSWYHLEIGISENEIEIDPGLIPGSTQALLKVTVSDGFNTISDVSDNVFTVPGHEPEAIIISPENNAVFKPGNSIWIQGQGYDFEESVLDGNDLEWKSDKDGVLGTGKQLLVDLSPGKHNLELIVSDSDGNKTSTSISVYIGFRHSIPILVNKAH